MALYDVVFLTSFIKRNFRIFLPVYFCVRSPMLMPILAVQSICTDVYWQQRNNEKDNNSVDEKRKRNKQKRDLSKRTTKAFQVDAIIRE